jgi:hypothetical protein
MGATGPTGSLAETWASVLGDGRLGVSGYSGNDIVFLTRRDSAPTLSNATLSADGTTVQLGGAGGSHTFLITWSVSIALGASEACTIGVLVNGNEDPALKSVVTAPASGALWTAATSAVVTIPDNAQLKVTRTVGTCALTGDYNVARMAVILLK